jgi:hypothetical protein
MTASIATAAIDKVVQRLSGVLEESQIHALHVASDLAEKTAGARYPSVHVHCDKIVNDQTEKFRTFSGRIASKGCPAPWTNSSTQWARRCIPIAATGATACSSAAGMKWH